MQGMSCLATEPPSTAPRLLRSDSAAPKPANARGMPRAEKNSSKLENKIQLIERTRSATAASASKILTEEPLQYSCSSCSSSFATKTLLQEHVRTCEDKEFACKVCDKVLSSQASLDRHTLVHSGERPFRCRMCDLSFTTNGNMHRHMRTHKAAGHDSNSEDSDGSVDAPSPPRGLLARKRRLEYNNNDKAVNGSGGNSADDEQGPGSKRKPKTINNNFIHDMMTAQRLLCPVCDREDFGSLNVLETHMEQEHPDYQVKCVSCNLSFKNYRVLNLHRFMVHHTDKHGIGRKLNANSVSGFNDCTFIDFSSQKFPQIAKTVCEQSVHKSVTEQQFRCGQCARDFPCESALDIHRRACFAETVQSSSRDSEDFSKRRHESSSTDEDVRRDDFFANLDLQNKSPGFVASTQRLRPEHKKPRLQADFYPGKDLSRPIVDSPKDLADIQSILSVTSTSGLLEQLTKKAHENSMAGDLSAKGSDEHEEVQDVFASEFRKMKLRGEFPCRLCTAVFPNLRALKGHNRVHLSGNGPGPYRCNMCPHSSLDKAALVRHMRTHNGDRPYECAVCNYAFTTKANCERHLRNRHSKITREEVKRSIIYHPSEDPNNDEVNSKMNISREEIKRSLLFGTPDNDHHDDERLSADRSTPVSHYTREATATYKDHSLSIPLPRDLSIVIPQPRDIMRAHCSMEAIAKVALNPEDIIQPRIKVKGFGQLTQIPEFTPDSDVEREADSEEEDAEPEEESFSTKSANYSSEIPMDLSTGECQENVLDLSKKRGEATNDKHASDAEAEDYPPKTMEFDNNHAAAASMFEKTQQILMAQQQLLKGVQMQKLDPAAGFYANQLSQLYRTGAPFPGLGMPPSFPLNPYFLQHHPFLAQSANPQDIAEMKERIQKEIIRGLQLSGGGLVGMDHSNIVNNMALANERLQAFHQQNLNHIASPDLKSNTPGPVIKCEEDLKPQLHVNTDTPTTIQFSNPMMCSPKIQKKDAMPSHSPNSVKMVIKNGVLMPKQKQRRYRTERPFSCEHCSARFTLRSNMERHIKQQHPQYWSQRQRSNIGNIPRKNPISIVPQNITVPSLNYENRLSFIKTSIHPNNDVASHGEDKESPVQSHGLGVPLNKTYGMISDQVKYAILAQQLKSQNLYNLPKEQSKPEASINGDADEEEEDDALIIDEEADDKSQVAKEIKAAEMSASASDPNMMAKKVAQQILIGVSAKTQNMDMSKDFDWKIAGNLISKNPQHINTPIIPTFVSLIGQSDAPKEAKSSKLEEGDLVPVSRLLDNAVTQLPFGNYFKNDYSGNSEVPRQESALQHQGEGSEEDEEGLVASSGSTSEGNNSGSDENRSESEATTQAPQKKKSAYSLAPNRVSCPYCHRKFPWSSSLRRHVLTHTGQKPYKCPHCPLLFTTKSNCDRHLLRKHGAQSQQALANTIQASQSAVEAASSVPGFLMRNVPERPYKCASCPSSTFSTLSNLKKHMSSKHGINIADSRPGSPKLDDGEPSRPESRENYTSDDEKPCKNDGDCDEYSSKLDCRNSSAERSDWENQISSSKCSPVHMQDAPSNLQNSDLPFKCHLCEGSYGERQEALDHIKDAHGSEFDLLMSKGALETSVPLEELGSSTPGHRSEGCDEQGSEENIEQLRGKFPDYANRKVVCAFCMRRFWSAEDLRRHMRTHTGERPFSCDVCRRRFTLKHSMLRHRKKHAQDSRSEDLSTASGDDEAPSPASAGCSKASLSPPNSFSPISATSTPVTTKISIAANVPHLTLNGYQMAINNKGTSTSPEVPSNVNNNNSPPAANYEGKVKMHNIKADKTGRNRFSSDEHETEAESGNDLIGNLLGISDRGMINKLLSSADEAAKLLGVNK